MRMDLFAISHVGKYQSVINESEFAWMWGQFGKPIQDLPVPEYDIEGEVARYEWSDGSSIVVAKGQRWTLGIHAERLEAAQELLNQEAQGNEFPDDAKFVSERDCNFLEGDWSAPEGE